MISSNPHSPQEPYSSGEEWPDDTPPECLAECTEHGFLLLPSGTFVSLARPVWIIVNPKSKHRTRKCVCDWSHAFESALNILQMNKDDFAREYEKSPWYAKDYLKNWNCDLYRNNWPPRPPPSQPKPPKKQAEEKRKLLRRHSDASSKRSSASRSSKQGSLRLGLPKAALIRAKSAAGVIKPFKSMLKRKSASDLFGGLKRLKSTQ